MSGEMCTSLGNGFTNSMVIRFIKMKMKEEADRHKVEGDDGISATMKTLREDLFKRLGLNIKIQTFEELCMASFCGQVFDEADTILTSPVRAIVLMPWIGSQYMFAKKSKQLGIFKSKCLSYLWQYNGCPIIMPYCLRMLDLLTGVAPRNIWKGYWMSRMKELMGGDFVPREITADGRRICHDLYHIPVRDQVRIEEEISRLTEITNYIPGLLPYLKPSWIENFENYVMQWTVADQVSMYHPPFPHLVAHNRRTKEPVVIVKKTTITTQLREIEQQMDKKTYMKTNQVAFRNLTPAERERKWKMYNQKQNRINALSARVPRNTVPRGKFVPKKKAAPKNTPNVLSRCLVEYAKASIDPFDQSIVEPCIPDNLVIPSYKHASVIQGQMVIGTQGVGVILFNPWTAAANDLGHSAFQTDFPILVSSGSYNVATINPDTNYVIGGQLVGMNSNSNLTVAYCLEQPFRLVAAGVELFYTGPLLSMAGAITTLQNKGLEPIKNNTTFNTLRGDPRSRTCSVAKGSRCYVSYYPTSNADLSYEPFSSYMPSRDPTIANLEGVYAPLVIAVSGAQPGSTFQFRAHCYYEAQLSGATFTPSHADPIGFPAFQSARTELIATDQPSADLKTVLIKTMRNVAQSVSGVLPMAGTALGTFLGNPGLGTFAGTASGGLLNAILAGTSEDI